MIGEGLELMLVGMGVVFSFLVLMVLLMRVSGALLSKLPEPEPVVQGASRAGNRSSGASGSSGVASAKAAKVAVALAAAYRAKRG
jgi:oxaloacetate decarboxylase gamma subunit